MAIPGLEVTYPLIDKGPGNPNIPPGGSADALAVRAERLRQAGAAAPTATTSTAAPNAPSAGQRLRSAGSNLVSGATYLGAGVAGQAAARSLRDMGGGVSGPGAVVGERQAGDSASSMQIPTGGPTAPSAQGYNFWTDSEAGRNIGNMANAVAPLGGVAMAARVPGAASRVAGLADAAVTGLASGVRGEREARTAGTPGLRMRPEDAFAGPPAPAAGAAPAPAAPANLNGNVTRNGNEYSGTDVRGNITINGFAPGAGLGLGSGPNAQNMAAANNLAATDSLRSQGAALGGQLAGGSGIPAMPQTLHSGNDWASRKNLENLRTSASSIYDSQSHWGNKTKGAADVAAFQNAQAMDTAARTGSDPGSVARTNAQASMFDSKMSADASRYSSDNSLRGTMYSSDATLGAKRMEMQQRLQQQQLRAAIFREAGGKPEVAAKIAAMYGMDSKDFTDMAAADQTRAQGAATSARKRLEGMAVRDDGKGGTVVDPGRVANLERTLTKMAPGWQHMSEPEQAELYGKAEASVNLLEGLNDRRNNSFWQSIGVDGKSASLDNLPDMKGGRLTTVKLLEGAMTGGGVSRGDYALEVGGHKLYLPRDKVNQGELGLLKARGVDISGMQK